ncbi:MAG: lipopolysaccharide biosynthesis protein, partial [Alphaproteobacteria bacterium]|nr:lipopolysaccharide biosynthesis protein [Alphaproteobacteria bacterium]
MPETSTNTSRIAKNTLLLYFRMLLTMGVSLYTSRVVLDVLGVEDYGIYNVVGGVVAILGFISGPMIEATQRFLNFYMGKNDSEGLNNVFNACQVIHFVVAIIVCIVAETIGLWFVYRYLVIPPERLDAAVKVFHLSVVSSVF